MCTLRDKISKRFSGSKSSLDNQLCKYEDLKNKSIIYQGNLQYLYNTTILGDSLFRTYFVVLIRIAVENFEDRIGLYVYTDEKKSPVDFFAIDQKTKITDQCKREIRPIPKCFLMELIFVDKEKSEIFGAKDNSERKIWMEVFRKILSEFIKPIPVSTTGYLIPQPIILQNLVRNNDQSLVRNHSNSRQNKKLSAILSDSDSSPYSKIEPTDYSQSSDELQLTTSNSSSDTFNWNEIFYSNQNDDYKSILVKTNDYGAFLIRPQSEKTSSSDHDYTLCVYYELNSIRCFSIYQSSKRRNEYSLSSKDSKSFIDIIELCEYYRTNPLPSLSKIFYLKRPYKSYENNSYYLE